MGLETGAGAVTGVAAETGARIDTVEACPLEAFREVESSTVCSAAAGLVVARATHLLRGLETQMEVCASPRSVVGSQRSAVSR